MATKAHGDGNGEGKLGLERESPIRFELESLDFQTDLADVADFVEMVV